MAFVFLHCACLPAAARRAHTHAPACTHHAPASPRTSRTHTCTPFCTCRHHHTYCCCCTPATTCTPAHHCTHAHCTHHTPHHLTTHALLFASHCTHTHLHALHAHHTSAALPPCPRVFHRRLIGAALTVRRTRSWHIFLPYLPLPSATLAIARRACNAPSSWRRRYPGGRVVAGINSGVVANKTTITSCARMLSIKRSRGSAQAWRWRAVAHRALAMNSRRRWQRRDARWQRRTCGAVATNAPGISTRLLYRRRGVPQALAWRLHLMRARRRPLHSYNRAAFTAVAMA